MFPNYICFNSELEVITKLYNNTLCYFFDFKELIQDIKNSITYNENFIEVLMCEFEGLYSKLKNDVIKEINETMLLVNRDIERIKIKIKNRDKLITKLNDCKHKLEIKNKIDHAKELKELLKKRALERENLVIKYQGIYKLYWKWERLSWRTATKPVYFDFGYDFILQRIGEDLFKKVEIKDFLKLHVSGYAVSNPKSFEKTYHSRIHAL